MRESDSRLVAVAVNEDSDLREKQWDRSETRKGRTQQSRAGQDDEDDDLPAAAVPASASTLLRPAAAVYVTTIQIQAAMLRLMAVGIPDQDEVSDIKLIT